MNPKQPKALYLADVLSAGFECDMEWYEIESARELRRLYEENVQMLAALRACDEAMSYMSEYDIPLTLPDQVKAAIAKATGEQQ